MKTIDTHSSRNIYSFFWLQDSLQIIYPHDQEGDEKVSIYLVDTQDPDNSPVCLLSFEDGCYGNI